MSEVGHNSKHAPLEERIFDDPNVSIEDVLAAVASRIERMNKGQIDSLSSTATQLACNKDRLPETFAREDVAKALNLLAHLETHGELASETRENVCAAAETFVSSLKTLCKPLDDGLASLEKVLRPRIEARLIEEIDAHNADRTEDEERMTTLTLRSSSGAKATLSDNEEVVVEDPDQIPREFCVPDAKLIAAAIKSGKNVPGVGKKRKTSLRISCK